MTSEPILAGGAVAAGRAADRRVDPQPWLALVLTLTVVGLSDVARRLALLELAPAVPLVVCVAVAAARGGWLSVIASGAVAVAYLFARGPVGGSGGALTVAVLADIGVFVVAAIAVAFISIGLRRRVERAFEARLGRSAGRVVELEERLNQAEKLVALGRLTGNVVHDFNNLLTAIRGHSEMILADTSLGPDVRAEALEIVRTADRAVALTQQLLAFSRQASVRPRELNLNDVVSGMSGLLRRLIGAEVELTNVTSPSPLHVRGDPVQLQMVVLNLALNARDAMPRGGHLDITTTALDLAADDRVSHPGIGPGAYAVLSVNDTGTGIDDQTRARMFEPFFTTKPAGRGTGLGLAATATIVEGAGGTIRVESIPGRGTRFSVYLPRVEGSTFLPAEGAEEPPTPIGRESILVVEDDDAVRAIIVRALGGFGYRVQSTGDGDVALRLAGSVELAIDLLLVDIGLPGMRGTEVAERIRVLRPCLPVLFVSGLGELGQGEPDGPAAGVAFLAKPFTSEALARAVRAVLDDAPRPDLRRRAG